MTRPGQPHQTARDLASRGSPKPATDNQTLAQYPDASGATRQGGATGLKPAQSTRCGWRVGNCRPSRGMWWKHSPTLTSWRAAMSRRSRDEARPLPKRTLERLAACEAVGLHYWSDHPWAHCVWAVDDHQQAHVVRINPDGTSAHVCGSTRSLVPAEQCAGDGEPVCYQPPGAA
jgi:hypothetical protein